MRVLHDVCSTMSETDIMHGDQVQKALAPVVLALGIPNVECKCLGSADDAGDPYLDFWFRVEAEEALDKTSEIFKKIGEERCHPMPPDPVEPDSSQSMSPEMRREAKAWLEWDKQITDRDMKVASSMLWSAFASKPRTDSGSNITSPCHRARKCP